MLTLLPSGFIGVLYQLLSDLGVKQLVAVLLLGLVIGGAAAGSGSSLLRMFMQPTMKRMNAMMELVSENSHEWTAAAIALKRIPSEQWFDDVADALKGIAKQADELAAHAKSIIAMEDKIRDIEIRSGVDREKFASLRGAHDERMVLGGCSVAPNGIERRSRTRDAGVVR
jgi:hypothetical protein